MQYCPASFDLIDPILFTIGPFDVFGLDLRFDLRWYALAYIAGLLLGWTPIVRNKLHAQTAKALDRFMASEAAAS